jgi:hypothetical protein
MVRASSTIASRPVSPDVTGSLGKQPASRALARGKSVASMGVALLGAKLFGLVGASAGAIVGAIVAQVLLFRRFASLSDSRLRDAQEWRGRARVFAASALAAATSVAAGTIEAPGGTLVRLAVAGMAFALVYRILLTVLALAPKVHLVVGARLDRMLGFGSGHA